MLYSYFLNQQILENEYFTLCRTSCHSLTDEQISVKRIEAMCQKRQSVYSVNKIQLKMVLYFDFFK